MRIAVTLAAVLAIPHAAAAQCALDSYTTDPAPFAAMPTQDFQGIADGTFSYGHTEASPYTADGVDYWPMFWVTTSWCIPGMDSNGGCGGTNHYLANGYQTWMKPASPSEAVAFNWGTQGADQGRIEVTLTDASVKVFNMPGTDGYFGYCTGIPGLDIERVTFISPDGGLDNIAFGEPGAAGPDLNLSIPPLVAGVETDIKVSGARPGQLVFLGRGSAEGAGPCPAALGGLCFDILDPQKVASAVADGTGLAIIKVTPPAAAVGRSVPMQAVGPDGANSTKSQVGWATVY